MRLELRRIRLRSIFFPADIRGTQMSPEFENKPPADSLSSEANTWAMILHLSIFASYAIPFAGMVLPIVIWQVKKDQFPIIDEHGMIVVNWMISSVIYVIAGILLSLILIGIPILVLVGIAMVVFPIIGGIKASSGELWPYPLSIKFFS